MREPTSVRAADCLRFEAPTLDLGGRVLLDAAGRDLGPPRSEFELLTTRLRSPGPALTRAQLPACAPGRPGAALDPEDLSEAVASFHACCAEIVGRFGGVVAPSGDDGVLAWFGYPEADELDAERAIRAALAVIAAVPQIKTGFAEPMRAR